MSRFNMAFVLPFSLLGHSRKSICVFFAAALAGCAQAMPEAEPLVETESVDAVLTPTSPELNAEVAKGDNSASLMVQYMLANNSPRYATLYVQCVSSGVISISVPESATPQLVNSSDARVHDVTDFNFTWQPFWQSYSVFFDGELVTFPPKYKTVIKQVSVGGKFETRSERVLITPEEDIYELLLPKLKTAKVMRLVKPNGVGPIFELASIKANIESLEAKCAPKDKK